MKQPLLLALCLILSTSVFAAANTKAPKKKSYFNFGAPAGSFYAGLTGLYLKPANTNGDLDYAIINPVTIQNGTNVSGISRLKNINPSYDWGYGFNVGIIVPETGNDLGLSFIHLGTTQTRSAAVASGDDIIAIPNMSNQSGINVNADSIASASARAQYALNQIDVTAGKFFTLGDFNLHPSVGLRLTRLNREIRSFYQAPDIEEPTNPNNTVAQYEQSTFNGLGPMISFEGSYPVGRGFGLVGGINFVLLVGNIYSISNVSIVDTLAPLSSANTNNQANSTSRVVSGFDAKLGAIYSHTVSKQNDGKVSLEIGYQIRQYFDAVDRLMLNSFAIADPVTTTTIVSRDTSSVNFNGPYITLTYKV